MNGAYLAGPDTYKAVYAMLSALCSKHEHGDALFCRAASHYESFPDAPDTVLFSGLSHKDLVIFPMSNLHPPTLNPNSLIILE